MARSKNQYQEINLANLGSTYYNILDVSNSKIVSALIEQSSELGLDSEVVKKISFIIESEISKTKDWGFDTLSKSIKS